MTARFADAQLAAWLQESSGGPTGRSIGAAALREAGAARRAQRPRGPEVSRVRDVQLNPGLGGRLYRPHPGSRRITVFVHGGMWLLCDLESHDRTCRQLTTATGWSVLAVDYRRGPESRWPAAVDDVVAALDWAWSVSDQVAIGGDSCGAHLAILACIRRRDQGLRLPSAMVLAYPNTDLTLSLPSVVSKGEGFGLDAGDLAWAVSQWLPDGQDPGDPDVSPLFADLRGLPPALVVTAEHDPLRDEGDAFAAALSDAGCVVEHRREPGMVHGFLLGMDLVSPAAAAATERLFADARELLGASP